jgi:hypothetical protein
VAIYELVREPKDEPASQEADLRALPDGRIVPLDWHEEEPEIDRGSDATWD